MSVHYLAKMYFGEVAKPIFAQITESDPKLAVQSADMARKAWEAKRYELIPREEGEWLADKPACPPGEEDSNTPSVKERAALALKALRGGGYHEGDGDEIEDYLISDLICDLLHLAQSKGFDPEQLSERAAREFEEEST